MPATSATAVASASVVMHLTNANKPLYEQAIRANAKWKDRVVTGHQSRSEHTVAICGAGPSLGEDAALLTTRKFTEIWACNRSLTWLLAQGYSPTHAIWVDPGDAWKDEWADPPDVIYYVSSSAKPALLEHLAAHHRRFRVFHNWIGVPKPSDDWTCPLPQHPEFEYETYLYATLYPTAPCVGAGLNVVNRALGLALFQGFRHIAVIGADCATRSKTGLRMPPEGADTAAYNAWVRDQQMYPEGNATTVAATDTLTVYGTEAALLEGIIDGRAWACRPDMIISAVNLVRLKQQYGHQIELVGDTLPNALLGKDEDFMKKLPSLTAESAIDGLVARGTSP